jgi:RNA polymerase sigma factor (sigma-70 family)
MRGSPDPQLAMLTTLQPGDLIPADHPIRRIRVVVDAVLAELDDEFDAMYAASGRPSVPLEDSWPTESNSPADVETRADLLVALEDLTEDQKTVVILRFVEGCSLAEAAVFMGKSTGAVKQLQHRAITALQRRMSLDEKAAG